MAFLALFLFVSLCVCLAVFTVFMLDTCHGCRIHLILLTKACKASEIVIDECETKYETAEFWGKSNLVAVDAQDQCLVLRFLAVIWFD